MMAGRKKLFAVLACWIGGVAPAIGEGGVSTGETRISRAAQAAALPARRQACGTNTPDVATLRDVEIAVRDSAANYGAVAALGENVVVEVWWHVINKGAGPENGDIAQAQIEEQIAVLNESFGGLTGGAVSPFQFVLAGVTRTTQVRWFGMTPGSTHERQAKTELRRGDGRTLNIYSCNPNGAYLGWATFPWQFAGNSDNDGVVIRFSTLPGGSYLSHKDGATAVHEVGHWLGLYHTFQGGCMGKGDYVNDTPSEQSPADGCPTNRDSCTTRAGADPVSNFMNYTDDACKYEFTVGQVVRMAVASSIFRGL